MLGLGVVGDVPAGLQPAPLPDGVHLRWASSPAIGFPWFGYYLFRREHHSGHATCFSQGLTGLSAGPFVSSQLATPMGVMRSDHELVLTDDFPPTGVVEFDLANRTLVELALASTWFARHAELTIGLREDCGTQPPARTCIDFRHGIESGENPRTVSGATFSVRAADGRPAPRTVVTAWPTNLGELTGLDCGVDLEISLPEAAERVDLMVTPFAAPVQVEGLDAAGQVVARASTHGPMRSVQAISLGPASIERVRVGSAHGQAALHELCFTATQLQAGAPPVRVRLYDGQTLVASADAAGRAGQVQTLSFDINRITRVQVLTGPAALVDVCVIPITPDPPSLWDPLPNFPYPLTLPVTHPDYPPRRGPTDAAADEALALSRVLYGQPSDWSGSPVSDLHDQLVQLVVGGPGSTPMAERTSSVQGVAVPPDPTAPTMSDQSPWGLVMLASLNPAVAQMLGLYWVDDTGAPGASYDYLIVADNTGVGALNPVRVHQLVQVGDWSQLDGYIVYGLRKAPSPPLEPPSNAEAYALPGTPVGQASGGTLDWSDNAGLTWNIPAAGNGALLPGSPVLYHVWRADLGDAAQPSAAGGYSAITRETPVLVVPPDPNAPPSRAPSAWPPFPLNYIDSGLPDGWYSYELSGIDIFGRHSANGDAAPWHQWAPAPDPKPWYYVDPAADRVIHPFAVRLEDVTPPPPPTNVQASALDPADPFLLKDTAYNGWYTSLAQEEQSVIGLRVSWMWTWSNQRQAPDAREFRIYLNPGRFNAVSGNVTAVSALSATSSKVSTDITNAQPADAYTGTFLQMGPLSYPVIGNDAGTPLVLRTQNTTNPTDPSPGTGPSTIAIPPGHPLATDAAIAVDWTERRYVVDYNASVTVTTDSDGNPLREYEILIPASGDADRTGFPLAPSISEPIVYAAVGVTAVDDKTYIEDAPEWTGTTWGGRYGNESFVAGPAIVFCVFRGPVPAPVVPADSDAVYASAADYHSHSFFTYRWTPLANTKMHIFRALDDAVFNAWWASSPRPTVLASDTNVFPDQGNEPRWTPALRAAVATDIQTLANCQTLAAARDYFTSKLSHDALRVLASIPTLRSAFSQITIQPLDPADSRNADRPGPDTPSGYVSDPALRAYIDTLDGRSTNRWFYRSAFVDGAHNLSEELSLASPPVYMPDVVAPRAPVITRVLGGERKVTISWAPNREPDIAEYRVLRADDAASAADPRLMTVVQTKTVLSVSGQPTDWSYLDTDVPPLQTVYYRLVAVDATGNASIPTAPVRVRAYDDALPTVPDLIVAWSTEDIPVEANISWSTTDEETLLEMRAASELIWQSVGGWRPAGTESVSLPLATDVAWDFRLRVRKDTGAAATGATEALEALS
jgi:hypothetical protein